ncbi:MAG TPA: Rpn family recombination-promoting nuclease/putative transposase [Gemmataceae bacterium]|jgi:predicted transposase/invertase (TIGR01784 family)|nr:Rpn family recombination-promoting nuclease/putative transposase [Gemmataceae bacterium]
MTTDPLFYRLFETSPETFFLLLGMSSESATAMAACYQFEAVEFKQTSHRTDGVFRPTQPGLPLYFVEVQFYRLQSTYADLLVKAYTYLKQNDPGQPFQGIVLFATRSLEPTALVPYQALLDAGIVRRFFVDELPEQPDLPLGMAILNLLAQAEDRAVDSARDLIGRVKQEMPDDAARRDVIQLVETVIMYKLASLSREEIQAMLKVDDIRDTRVYREAQEEGRQEGRETQRQQQLQRDRSAIAKLAQRGMSAAEIADALSVELDFVRETLAK